MAAVAIVPHLLRPEAAALAGQAVDWLTSNGHEVRVAGDDPVPAGLAAYSVPPDALTDGLDLAVAIGGDGTILRAVDLVCGTDVPILGVNVGQLGYLTEVEPGGLRAALEEYFAGRYIVEQRMMLEVRIEGNEAPGRAQMALNEVVLGKTAPGHTVRIAILINEQPFLTIAADGLIVASPTGSTAYNLSARGPIVSPRLRALVVTPVSPHTLFDRSLVLGDGESVRLEILDGRPADVVVDGNSLGVLVPGDAVSCRAAPHNAHLVSFHGRDFHQILKAKFSLADR